MNSLKQGTVIFNSFLNGISPETALDIGEMDLWHSKRVTEEGEVMPYYQTELKVIKGTVAWDGFLA